MTTGFYLVTGGSAAALILIGFGVVWCFSNGFNVWPLPVSLFAFVGAIGFILVLLIVSLTYRYDKINCYRFGENSNRSVKFVKYSTWSWDCLTPTANGHWIPIDQLRSIGKDNG